MEPRYVIRPSEARVLIPETLKVVFLCAVLYAGVWVNALLLGWDIPNVVNVLIFSIIGVLVVLDVFVRYIKTRKLKAELYLDRIILRSSKGDDEIMISSASTSTEKNIYDKIFGTGTINISDRKIRYIRNPEQIANYLDQSIKYAQYYSQYGERSK